MLSAMSDTGTPKFPALGKRGAKKTAKDELFSPSERHRQKTAPNLNRESNSTGVAVGPVFRGSILSKISTRTVRYHVT